MDVSDLPYNDITDLYDILVDLKSLYDQNLLLSCPKYPSNQQLANWVKQQRTHYRFLQQGKYSSLTDERIFLLDSIGFVWKTKKGEKHKHISTTSPINNDEASKPSEEVKEASATLSLLARQDDTAETRPTYAASVFFSAAEPLPDPLSELLYTSLHGL